jgi:mRNA-degrading endonuclease RelE of RelBE toxin-antitoxin system
MKIFGSLPKNVQRLIENKLDEMGMRLVDYPHHRLTGSPEYRFRVGDYRIIYEFDAEKNVTYLLAVGRRDKIYKRR